MKSAIYLIKSELSGFYETQELRTFTRIIFQNLFGMSLTDLVLHENKQLTETEIKQVQQVIDELKNYKPIQYIFNRVEFYGLNFYVNKHSLIPRPETEELVDWIIKDCKGLKISILDIGTGSACIPIALARNLPKAKFEAYDVSKKALEVARKNAANLQVDIQFHERDILKWKTFSRKQKYDVIVSNPPYVRESEKQQMQANVLDYEPDIALFVENDNALIFYEAIAEFAQKHLKKGGSLYFEINEFLGIETVQLLENKGFTDIILKKDLNNKNRMIKCKRQKLTPQKGL